MQAGQAQAQNPLEGEMKCLYSNADLSPAPGYQRDRALLIPHVNTLLTPRAGSEAAGDARQADKGAAGARVSS